MHSLDIEIFADEQMPTIRQHQYHQKDIARIIICMLCLANVWQCAQNVGLAIMTIRECRDVASLVGLPRECSLTLYPANDSTQPVEYSFPGVDTLSMLDCERQV